MVQQDNKIPIKIPILCFLFIRPVNTYILFTQSSIIIPNRNPKIIPQIKSEMVPSSKLGDLIAGS